MFRRKPKPDLSEGLPSIHEMAGHLGIERRRALRVRYPRAACRRLPRFFVGATRLGVHDLSLGGCCALDPEIALGGKVGVKSALTAVWPDGEGEEIAIRIISRVDQRVHIQFLGLSPAREEQIRLAITCGARGQWLRQHRQPEGEGRILLAAREMWSSSYGDAVVIKDDVHLLAQITLFGVGYDLYRAARPVKRGSVPLSLDEIEDLALFLCNIPQPSDWLSALVAHIELLASTKDPEGAR